MGVKGWVLYKDSQQELSPRAYGIKRLIQEANECGIDIRVLKPEQIDLIVTREDRKSIMVNGESITLPDFVIPRMGAGTTYFALAVIRHLERLGIRSFNSSQSIDTVKDKLYTQQILAQNNLPVPKTMLVRFPVNANLVEKQLGFPIIIKHLSGSQGNGIFLSENKESFLDLMQLIEMTNRNATIILQEFISSSKGRDLRVFTIGGRVIACMERCAQEGGFKANFSRGGTVRKHEINAEIEWLATETSRIFGLDIAGVDLLFDKDHYKICEANSSPGFEGLESCCEMNIAKEIYNYVRFRLGAY